jgi:hypothetical protein
MGGPTASRASSEMPYPHASSSAAWFLGLGLLPASEAAEPNNRYVPYPAVENIAEGTSWPEGQALPIFATPADELDMILVQDLSRDELVTFSALQGQVNRSKPRIYLQNARAEEGPDTWPETPAVGIAARKPWEESRKYELLAKYAREIRGLVLYDPGKSPHFRNLAGTAAAIHRALPVTPEIHGRIKEMGIELKVIEDLTPLELSTPLEIYGHLHEKYWPHCEKRLIVSARPFDRGGDLHHTRDIAAATGAAVVWLDTLKDDERDMLRKFFADMEAGNAIALGWYASERSGITTASEFGIGTLPADFYVSGSVFSGSDHRIRIPEVPKMPELDDKAYVAIFISDGDNIQYTQHAMRRIWDRNAGVRGKVPLNWTIAPGLVDIGPGILNYYYGTATPNDCFVAGPSGMGYLMPYNTLTEPGAPVGEYTRDPASMAGYTRLTETYLQRSGLRVVTIWDDATPMQRAAYETRCRNLYGATVQNFRDVRTVSSSVANDRIRFDKLVIPYAGSYQHISGSMNRELRRWNGKEPLFLSYQMDVWHEMKPDRILALHEEITGRFRGKVEFVRADHYFNLYNQAHGLPFNLCLSPATTVRARASSETGEALTDGTPATLWTAPEMGRQTIGFGLKGEFTLSRCVIRHAGDHGLPPELNTRSFRIEGSTDGKSWKSLGVFTGNTTNVTDIDLDPIRARYVRIAIEDPGADDTARIADIEIYGRR